MSWHVGHVWREKEGILSQDQPLHKAIKSDSERGAAFPRLTWVCERPLAGLQGEANQSESHGRKDLTHNPGDLTTGEAATETPRVEGSN